MMPEETTSNYRTKDLVQAAFFWSQAGSVLAKVDREVWESPSRKGLSLYFNFELPIPQEDLGALVLEYANRRASVEPIEFMSKLNSLKEIISTEKSK